jgi:peptide/nickel transport system permease protein
MSFGFVIGGSLLVEIVFSYPGMGFRLLQAVNSRDYPVMQGIFLMITATVLIANFIADMSYVLLDPRARSGIKVHNYGNDTTTRANLVSKKKTRIRV